MIYSNSCSFVPRKTTAFKDTWHTMLTQDQIANYHQQGFLIVENAVPAGELRSLQRSLDAWIELSKQYTAPFGRIRDGRPRVVPDSHKGPICSLWHDGLFTGAVTNDVEQACERNAIECVGSSGTVCLMHTLALHGLSPDLSTTPHPLFIVNLTSAGALPPAPNAVPSDYSGAILSGHDPGIIRTQRLDLETPEIPFGAPFIDQQSQTSSF